MFENRNKTCGNCTQYRRCAKTKRRVMLETRACNNHFFISEQNELRRVKASERVRNQQKCLTLEQKAARNKKISLGMQNMSAASQEIMHKNQSIAAKIRVANTSIEEKTELSKKISICMQRIHANRTVEENIAIGRKIKEARASMPLDRHNNMLEKQRRHAFEREARKTAKEKEFINNKISASVRLNYQNKAQEEKDYWKEHCRQIAIDYHSNKTLDDEYTRASKIQQAQSTPEARKRNSKKAVEQLRDPNNNFGNYPERRFYKNTNIVMRSGWETDFASKLDSYNINWLYEYKTFWLDTIKTHYTPDFFLPELNCYIEVKSLYYLDDLVYKKIDAIWLEHKLHVFLMYDNNWNIILNILRATDEAQNKFLKLKNLNYRDILS